MDRCAFYCLSFNNEQRKQSMIDRFKKLNMNVTISEGVNFKDERICNKDISEGSKRVWSTQYGHLDMIHHFYYNTNKEFGVFSEDDILIHKNLPEHLPTIITDFEEMKLDVLLIGYLCAFTINDPIKHLKNSPFIYHHFPDNIWGAQMYMLSRTNAKKLLDKYTSDYYAVNSLTNPDFTITKDGKRALLYPPYVIEDGLTYCSDKNHMDFHKMCHDKYYNPETFI